MSESKTNKKARAARLSAETRCVYCANPPDSIEHMPPVAMFRGKHRPNGLEFAACSACNNGTRSADVTAAFIARLTRDGQAGDTLIDEARNLREMLAFRAPGVLDELFDPSKASGVPMKTTGGVFVRRTAVICDGPRLKAHLDVFSAKLGMALYREHVGEALPVEGAVSSMWFLNSGLAKRTVEVLLSKMPAQGTLQQGQFSVADQFGYRFNCDQKTILAALAAFHGGLYVFTLAMAEPEKYPLNGSGKTGSYIHPGALVSHLPSVDGLVPVLRPGVRVRMPRP